MLVLEPILVMVAIYLSIVYGMLYGCKRSYFPSFVINILIWTNIPVFEAFPIIFIDGRGFTIAQDGLVFICVGIGTTIGAVISYCSSAHYPELIKKWIPTSWKSLNRLLGAINGSPILVIGIFCLGWTGQCANIPWHVPALSTIFLGVGISLIFMSFLVRWQLIDIPTNLYLLFFLSPELPRRYISVSLTLMNIFLTFIRL